MEGNIGEIRLFVGTKTPSNWLLCDGSACEVNDFTEIYAVIGNIYGGDASRFLLPDLRGRIPVGAGQGPGLPAIALGEQGGSETVTLTLDNLPPHDHKVRFYGYDSFAANDNIDGHALAGGPKIYNNDTFLVAMGPQSVVVSAAGGGNPVKKIMPVQAINYIICVKGVFPQPPEA